MDVFFIEDKELLKKDNIWNKISNSMKKEFYSKPIYYKNLRKKYTVVMSLQIFMIKKFLKLV